MFNYANKKYSSKWDGASPAIAMWNLAFSSRMKLKSHPIVGTEYFLSNVVFTERELATGRQVNLAIHEYILTLPFIIKQL